MRSPCCTNGTTRCNSALGSPLRDGGGGDDDESSSFSAPFFFGASRASSPLQCLRFLMLSSSAMVAGCWLALPLACFVFVLAPFLYLRLALFVAFCACLRHCIFRDFLKQQKPTKTRKLLLSPPHTARLVAAGRKIASHSAVVSGEVLFRD